MFCFCRQNWWLWFRFENNSPQCYNGVSFLHALYQRVINKTPVLCQFDCCSIHTSGPLQASVSYSPDSQLPLGPGPVESTIGPSILPGLQSPTKVLSPPEISAATEMNLSALYMHQVRQGKYGDISRFYSRHDHFEIKASLGWLGQIPTLHNWNPHKWDFQIIDREPVFVCKIGLLIGTFLLIIRIFVLQICQIFLKFCDK